MKIKLIFLFAINFSFGVLFAQSDYREGYIIKTSNDTIQGLINNKGNLKTLRKCRFKVNNDAEYVDYSPKEIQAFRIYSGGYYASLTIENEGQQEDLFVEQLVDGIVDVFYYAEINDGYYLMRTEDGELYKLKNSKIEVTTDDGTYEKRQREYVNLLRYLLQDSPSAVKKVDYLPYEANALIGLAEDYHNDVCDDYECIVYAKERIKPKLYVGIYAGYSLSKITVFDNEYTQNLNKSYAPSNDVSFGFFLNYMDPNISQRFSVQLDLMFQESSYVADESRINIGYLRIPFSIKYAFPAKKIVPALGLGLSYNMWTSFSDENVVPSHLPGVSIQQNQDQFGLYASMELSYKIGKRVNFFIQGKYERYKGKHKNVWIVPLLAVNDHFSSKSSFMSVVAGFRF